VTLTTTRKEKSWSKGQDPLRAELKATSINKMMAIAAIMIFIRLDKNPIVPDLLGTVSPLVVAVWHDC
jgi:hypothetical protein